MQVWSKCFMVDGWMLFLTQRSSFLKLDSRLTTSTQSAGMRIIGEVITKCMILIERVRLLLSIYIGVVYVSITCI